MEVRCLSPVASARGHLARQPERARKNGVGAVGVADPALASGDGGEGVKVEGEKVVGVFVGREREGCWVVPHQGAVERTVGSVGCAEPSKLSGWPHISRAAV